MAYEIKKTTNPTLKKTRGSYFVKFPYHTQVAKSNSKYAGTHYGTKTELQSLVAKRDIAAEKFYKAGVTKAANLAKEKKEKLIKETIDSFFEKKDFKNFRIRHYDSQLKQVLESGNVRTTPGGRVPPKTSQYIRDALAAGPDSKEFKELIKITGRTQEALLDFSSKIPPPATVDIALRSKAAVESFPEWRKLTDAQKQEAEKKIQVKRKTRLDKVTGKYGKYLGGTDEFPFHHIKQIGGEIPLTDKDVVAVTKKMNSRLSPYNKKLNDIADGISEKITQSFKAMGAKEEWKAKDLLKEVDELNNNAEQIVKKAIKELPSEYKSLIGFNKFTAVTDEYGLPIDDKPTVERIGGGIQKGEIAKPLTQYSRAEIAELQNKVNNQVEILINKTVNTPGGCQAVVKRALGAKGGLFGETCEKIIRADPERAAIKLNNTITATKGPLKNLKDDSQKLIRLFRGESFPQRNMAGFKSGAKHWGTTLAEMKKDTLSGQWYTPTQGHASSYLSRPGQMKYVDVTPQELEAFNKYKARVNKRPVKYSTKKKLGLPDPPTHGVTESFHHQIIPRYKLKEMEKAGRIKTKWDLNPLGQRSIGRRLVGVPKGVLEWDSVLGGFVDSANPSEVVGQNQLKAWAADNPMPVKVGEAAPGILKKTGKALAHLGLPLPTAAMDAYFIGREIEAGKSPEEIARNPLNWLGLATMDPLTKIAGVAEKSGKLASIMRLGMSPGLIRGATRFLGLPGLALSTGLTAYDQYQKYKNKEGFVYNLFNREEIDNAQV